MQQCMPPRSTPPLRSCRHPCKVRRSGQVERLLLHGNQPELSALHWCCVPRHIVSAGGGNVLHSNGALNKRSALLCVGVNRYESIARYCALWGAGESVAPPECYQCCRSCRLDI